ncbi:MAG TPA: hypothetical protein VIS54_04920, partial [Psychromonas sp.]
QRISQRVTFLIFAVAIAFNNSGNCSGLIWGLLVAFFALNTSLMPDCNHHPRSALICRILE